MVKIHRYVILKSFLVPLVVSSVFSTVIPLALLGIPSNAVAAPVVSTVRLNGSSAPVTVAPGGTITINVLNPTGNARDWIGIYLVGQSAAYPAKSVVEHYVAGTVYRIPTMTPAGTYEARLFANDSLTLLATSAPITVSTGTPPPPVASPPPPVASPPPPVASPPPPVSGCPSEALYVSTNGSDSNPGTQAAPWRTMTKAVATMTA